MGQPRPHSNEGGVPALPNFVGSVFMHTPFVTELPIWRGNTWGVYLNCVSSQESGVPAHPIFKVLSYLCLYTLWRRTTKFDVVL